MDESGSPGIANDDNDWLVVCLVVFSSKSQARASEGQLNHLRAKLGLKEAYEFHRAHNSRSVQLAMEREIKKMDFVVAYCAIRKSKTRNVANYRMAAEKILDKICQHNLVPINIRLDINPNLKKYLKSESKKRGLAKVKIAEQESYKSNGIQIADYAANIIAREVKKTGRAGVIAHRCLAGKIL